MGSSGDVVIRVEGLGKRYRVGELRTSHDTLRDALVRRARGATRALDARLRRKSLAADEQSIWALRDVSFEVRQGEVVGIIGANGAGKSTLLKILTRITEPTTGQAEVHGRVGSLLEVGTGFHPELTGRENIYLNGAILGMRRSEIDRKFDEIVEFAEVTRFLDTPVKRYSSGMYLRLAFAVAAHLEPEILIVDEVLAVGDASFQKKCLGKMGDVARGGRPVLFVSHNMNAIQRLCTLCGHLQHGELVEFGVTPGVVARYLAGTSSPSAAAEWIDTSRLPRQGSQELRVQRIRYESDLDELGRQPYPGGPLTVQLAVDAAAPRRLGSLAVTLYEPGGTKLVNADTLSFGQVLSLDAGINVVSVHIDQLYLNPGIYALGFWLADPDYHTIFDFTETAVQIEVLDIQKESLGRKPGADGVVVCHFQVTQATTALAGLGGLV